MPKKTRLWFSGAPDFLKRNVSLMLVDGKIVAFAVKHGKKKKIRNIAPGYIIPTDYFKALVKNGRFRYGSARTFIDDMRLRIFEIVPKHTDYRVLDKRGVALSPITAFEEGKGECFQKASLIAAIAEANGFKARIVGGEKVLRFTLKEALANLIYGSVEERKAVLFGGKHYWTEIWNGFMWEAIDTIKQQKVFNKKGIRWKNVKTQDEIRANIQYYIEY